MATTMTGEINVPDMLTDHFDAAAAWVLQGNGDAEGGVDEDRADAYSVLADTVDDLPLTLVKEATRVASEQPERFQAAMESLIRSVGVQYQPASAAQFLQRLIETMDVIAP